MKRPLKRFASRLKNAEHWLTAQVSLAALALLRRLPPDKALNFAERVARRIGPLFGRHRVALSNLRKAYPEKSDAEIEAIASDMWANMARLAVEYVFLDKLFDFDPEAAEPGRVEVEGIEIFKRVRAEDRPHIFFTAHIGNFEFLPIAAATFGLDVSSLFRPPNNPYIADYIHRTRRIAMGRLVPSRAGAALQLARILEEGGNIGALVDQKFMRGVRTRFFGRECNTSPLVPKLARQYDCDVYPAHCIRLPGGRFRLMVGEKLVLPRDEGGSVDIERMAQQLNDVVEEWVRADPGQWMWFHKRWDIRGKRRR
ncbi:lipid A biosynthesis lauroyl acyltransferase [Chelativorans sp. M5D2P16]|uniref:lipid A biosynthesis lauroyl acyltransferase n=1 Tax=Chelativorans sp. M5D2P16 TaxID=3095678 RepID=UPI002ACA9A1F|nr:lipid A biosynthesis lauroyl acyltransferase [Chelativorans sp. M5D2P16]MDZ5698264.1 lipid A biosynthesis lauroyl acyltransferase [Chelativorans sp. M5D2P16]